MEHFSNIANMVVVISFSKEISWRCLAPASSCLLLPYPESPRQSIRRLLQAVGPLLARTAYKFHVEWGHCHRNFTSLFVFCDFGSTKRCCCSCCSIIINNNNNKNNNNKKIEKKKRKGLNKASIFLLLARGMTGNCFELRVERSVAWCVRAPPSPTSCK